MAYAVDPTQDQQNQQAQTPGTQAPVATSAAPGSGPGGAKTPTGAPTQAQSAQPFTNLQQYLTANAPQIQQQANTISTGLTNQYGQVQGDINKGASDFGQQVAAGYTPQNDQVVQQAAADPTKFASDPNNVTAFQSQLNDQYTGTANFEGTAGYAPLNSEVTNASANAATIATPAGLQDYLKSSSPNETQGDSILDASLIGANPQSQQQIMASATPFSQLPQYLSNAVTTADQTANAAPGAARQAAADAAAAFTGPNGVVPAFQNTLNTQLSGANTSRDSYNNVINSNLTSSQQTQAALNNAYPSSLTKAVSGTGNLGNPTTDAAEKARITGLLNSGYSSEINALQQYLNGQPLTQLGDLGNVSTTANYQEDSALQNLLGSLYSPSLDQANIGEAGTFNVPITPGTSPSAEGEVQYLSDLASLYGNPNANYWNAGGGAPGGTSLSPAQQAQKVINQNRPGTGINLDAANLAALQRLVNGEKAFGS